MQAISALMQNIKNPVKAESAPRSSNTLPSKGLRWLENGQVILTALYSISGSCITYCFDKKGLGSQDIQE
jgi:hypothetical protein